MARLEYWRSRSDEEVRYRLALDAARIGTWTWDPDTNVVEWDPQMEACYGLAPGAFDGTLDAYLRCVHPDDRNAVSAMVVRARDSGGPLTFEHRAIWPDGSVHWLEARGRDVRDSNGNLIRMVGVGIDIDQRKQLEGALEEADALRASALLAQQLQAAEHIAELGSWYWDARSNRVTLSMEMVHLCGGGIDSEITGQQFRDVLRGRSHPDDLELLASAPADALRNREPFWIEQRLRGDGDFYRHVLHRGEMVIDDRGVVIGIRGTTQDVTRQRDAEQALVETQRRLAEERRAVEVLHQTLIRPVFPPALGYSIAATYIPPEGQPKIGGDWYDAFEIPDGRIVIGIGDISGHGVSAARLMAKLRHATRAYSVVDPDPANVLTKLDRFVDQFGRDEEFATVTIGLLDPTRGTVQLASAGHLPPLLVDVAGPCFVYPPAGLPLGVGRGTESPRETAEAVLGSGSALVLYTDGLVERRGEQLDAGLGRLASAGRAGACVDLDRLVRDCLDGTTATDDICVLVLERS